jgi:DNA-binding winged helix-turn-helix (wHTH) protein
MSTQLTPVTRQLEAESAVPLTFSTRYVRFGSFQADVQRQELFLNGQRVKMQAKVYHALVLLLSRCGEIVTREEVRKHLWPDMFLANLDANVNTTMNKLRQVLADSPDNPQYIETIPRRGYSFIARLEFSDVSCFLPSEAVLPGPPPLSKVESTSEPVLALPVLKWPMFLRMAGLVVAGMLLGALITFVWFVAQEKNHRSVQSATISRSYTPNSASLELADSL